jgi:hypothetical protein
MNQFMKIPTLFALTVVTATIFPGDSLVGKWTIAGANEFVDFRKDGSYEVHLPNGEVGERGSYTLNKSVFKIRNEKPVCGEGYWGTYTITFFDKDSVTFTVVADTCTERRMDIVGYNPGLRRMKEK